ncbi:MAG: phosphoadenosine phosphosulfate reductase family protein, partial [Fusobacteriaceae bacterium]
MKPVFKQELDFLQVDSRLEGYLWVNARCYYAFDKDYNKVKFGRSLDKLPSSTSNLLTHKEYCDFYYSEYTNSKVEYETAKLKEYLAENEYDEVIISVSGGKDSTVMAEMCLNLAKSTHKTRVLFGNTSNETHFTYKYVKDTYGEELEIANPKEGFFPWVKRTGYVPTRFGRVCCSLFKEGNIGDYLDDNKKTLQLFGIRRDESLNRSTYEQVMLNTKWNKKQQENWRFYCPIIEFNDLDVWSYLISRE